MKKPIGMSSHHRKVSCRPQKCRSCSTAACRALTGAKETEKDQRLARKCKPFFFAGRFFWFRKR
ncbi:hypothetical protein EOE66_09140 [Rubrivivax rivuli]|uniref:Uncharacterized protein n=2 Tax=Rubrivivax rivuli TaxID=1862385 RepID=A0A437RH16_9BURK|nr:hypothetical protein EOE66_09140 [Rubrivivax rivuli]